jgi:hypothetical protein
MCAAFMDKKMRKFLLHGLNSVFSPMVRTVIFMERLRDSMSNPVATR